MWIVWRIGVRFGILRFGGQRVWRRQAVVEKAAVVVVRRGECPVGVNERMVLEKKEAIVIVVVVVNRSGRKWRGLGDELMILIEDKREIMMFEIIVDNML
jgi:hypothetical protein